jgi:flagellar hook protein FlgE
MPFRIGLSGLNAASADLKVTGNNISNSGTTGFKESRAEFADVFSQAYGGITKTAIGSGVRLAATPQQFSQGNIEYTENSLDLAINGQGFFVLNDGGSQVYTRAGAFQVDRDGYVVNSGGQRLQVFAPVEEGKTDTTFNTGKLTDLKLDFGDNAPTATTKIDSTINLRSDATQIMEADGVTPVTFDSTDPKTYNYSTSLTLYDSLGTPRTATMYFVKTADPLVWESHVQLDGAIDPTVFPAPDPQTLTFDSNGKLVDPTAAVDYEFDMTNYEPVNGATIGPIDTTATPPAGTNIVSIDYSGVTQYGTAYSVSDLSQDGYTTGRLTGFDVDQSGVVFARYSNGHSAELGEVALANFANPQGLGQVGDNNWVATYAAGDPVYGDPGTSNLGTIQSGGLEASNVDIAEELVNLITAQRNFQANAQTITTADTITQTVINMVK